jgi:hypothetical protein
MSIWGGLELEAGELFNLPVQDRKKLIESGVDLLIEQVILLSYKQNKTFLKVINETLFVLDGNIEKEKQNENYELCYYLEELKWGVHRRLEEIKKIK